MNEKLYRLCIVVLFGILVVGSLSIGSRMAENGSRVAENGRWVQLDRQKSSLVVPSESSSQGYSGPAVIDTRTGAVRDAKGAPEEADSKQ